MARPRQALPLLLLALAAAAGKPNNDKSAARALLAAAAPAPAATKPSKPPAVQTCGGGGCHGCTDGRGHTGYSHPDIPGLVVWDTPPLASSVPPPKQLFAKADLVLLAYEGTMTEPDVAAALAVLSAGARLVAVRTHSLNSAASLVIDRSLSGRDVVNTLRRESEADFVGNLPRDLLVASGTPLPPLFIVDRDLFDPTSAAAALATAGPAVAQALAGVVLDEARLVALVKSSATQKRAGAAGSMARSPTS